MSKIFCVREFNSVVVVMNFFKKELIFFEYHIIYNNNVNKKNIIFLWRKFKPLTEILILIDSYINIYQRSDRIHDKRSQYISLRKLKRESE